MFEDTQCIACEGYGNFRTWTGAVASLLCPKHNVELSEWIAKSPEFRAYHEADVAWKEYVTALAGGAICDPSKGKRAMVATDKLAAIIRKHLKQWARAKPKLVAKRRAQDKAGMKATMKARLGSRKVK